MSFCQTPVQVLGLGVDFILPLSQQEQQQEEEPHQNIQEGSVLKIRNLANRLYSSDTNQISTPQLPSTPHPPD